MYKYLLLFTIAITLFSCNAEPVKTPSAKLSGNIEGLENKMLLLVNKSETDTIKLDSIGSFKFEKNYSTPTYSKLYLGRKNITLYLNNNSKLLITTSKSDFGKITKFTGEGFKENQLLNDKMSLSNDLKYLPGIFKLNPQEFIAKSDSIKQLFLNLSDTYSKNNKIDSTFLSTYNVDVKYEQLLFYTIYNRYHKHYTKEEASLSDKDKEKVKSARVDIDKYAISDKYIEFMSSILKNEHTNEIILSDEADDFDLPKYLKWINSELNSTNLKNSLFYNEVKYSITYANETERDEIYSTFSELNTDTIYKKNIDEVYKSFEKLRKGKPAPKWSYANIDDKEYSLDSFKGKFVYIDVWATWCGPCIAEIPELKKLTEDYKNKDIVFVSVSIDDNKNAWEKMIKKENFDWIQIHAEKAWKSEIVIENGIRGIPRFMMVDKQGNIVDVNAPEPSSEKIRLLIDKLLSE